MEGFLSPTGVSERLVLVKTFQPESALTTSLPFVTSGKRRERRSQRELPARVVDGLDGGRAVDGWESRREGHILTFGDGVLGHCVEGVLLGGEGGRRHERACGRGEVSAGRSAGALIKFELLPLNSAIFKTFTFLSCALTISVHERQRNEMSSLLSKVCVFTLGEGWTLVGRFKPLVCMRGK